MKIDRPKPPFKADARGEASYRTLLFDDRCLFATAIGQQPGLLATGAWGAYSSSSAARALRSWRASASGQKLTLTPCRANARYSLNDWALTNVTADLGQ